MKLYYNTNPVDEKELEKKTLDELVLKKWEELNIFTTDIPVLVTIWVALFTYQYSIWYGIWITLLVCVIVEWYIVAVRNTTKDNIKKYDKAILKKMKEEREENEKYKKEVLKYLKKSAEK
jgi:hypothetical protein